MVGIIVSLMVIFIIKCRMSPGLPVLRGVESPSDTDCLWTISLVEFSSLFIANVVLLVIVVIKIFIIVTCSINSIRHNSYEKRLK